MKAATVNELKQELAHQSPRQLIEFCTRLARFKKENKELLSYLLFEAHDEQGYIKAVKDDIDEQFAVIPQGNSLYLIKKSLRKILRMANKHIRYTGSKTGEIQLLLHYCCRLKQSGIPFRKSAVLLNLYQHQLKKINAAIATLHEDLQYDYRKELEGIEDF